MRNKRLQSQVTAGRWTLPAVIFICALCWVLTYFLFPDSIASTTPKESSSFLQSTRDLLLPGWAERIVSFLIYAIIGYFLIELNNQFSIIRMRASMQTAIYFLYLLLLVTVRCIVCQCTFAVCKSCCCRICNCVIYTDNYKAQNVRA